MTIFFILDQTFSKFSLIITNNYIVFFFVLSLKFFSQNADFDPLDFVKTINFLIKFESQAN